MVNKNMSRIGKQPIIIPDDVEVKIDKGVANVKGPKGELNRVFDELVVIEKKDNYLELHPKKVSVHASALWGTYASLLKNMITGVTEGYAKTLILEGVGYKVSTEGNKLVLSLGFSHPVEMKIPEGISINVEKNKIEVSGIDKELVGEVSAKIRAFKKPEPYKGKGIRYENEVIRRKAGKKAIGVS